MEAAIPIREARAEPGLRLVLLQGLPSPCQAATGICEIEGRPFQIAHPLENDPREALRNRMYERHLRLPVEL